MYVCVPWNWGSMQLWATRWVLGIEAESSEAQPQLSHLSSPGICSKFIVISQNISCSWAGTLLAMEDTWCLEPPYFTISVQDKLGVSWRQLLLSSAYKSDQKHSSPNPSTLENRGRHIYVSEFEASLVCRASTCVSQGYTGKQCQKHKQTNNTTVPLVSQSRDFCHIHEKKNERGSRNQ